MIVSLTTAETESIRASFGMNGAVLAEIKKHVRSLVLPKLQVTLGWKDITAAKGRVNDHRTVDLKYNSLFHRDRHILGTAPAETLHSVAKQNFSAVVYLDPSHFEFIEGSAVSGPHASSTPRELLVAEGSILVFPSCLIHRAVSSEQSKQRRTIVLFDLEDPSEPAPLRHDIIQCPWWTQKPLLHTVQSEEEVEQQMLADLLASRTYFWRYFRRGALCRTHWQVTSANDEIPTADADGWTVPYNTSFYLIAPHEYASHVRVHDHRGTARYLWNLVCFHLGGAVLA